MIESMLYSLVTGTANIATLLGNRFYPEGDVPDKPTLPFATHARISTAHRARTHTRKTYNTPMIQIDCYARTPLAAKQLAETIDTELDNYRGTVGSWRVDAIHVVDIRDSYESETGDFICSVDLVIWAISS